MAARTPEQLAWDALKGASPTSKIDLHRNENSAAGAMPDVVGINSCGSVFWLELKALREWPKRATTVPLKNKFEKGQLTFARRWNIMNGNSFVLLRVEKTFYLFKPIHRTDSGNLDSLTQSELIANSLLIGKPSEIVEYLENLK